MKIRPPSTKTGLNLRPSQRMHPIGEWSTVEMLRWKNCKFIRGKDSLAAEEPLEIRVRGKCVGITMRTPGHDDELAAGFLLSEGIISRREDIIEIASCERGDARELQNTLNVFLSAPVVVDFEKLTRHVFASSSCGLCGKTTIDSVHQHFAPVDSSIRVPVSLLSKLPQRLRASQTNFDQTGGLHAAGIFDIGGKLLCSREDIGRHNAVDKAIGFAFLNNLLPLDKHILLVSGRASFEILQKALAARIAIVCAISAPSSLAVDFAEESRQTLVGFLRSGRMNIYSAAERLKNS